MILIIGAGITGLTTAACLEGEVLIVERDSEVGGYCRTTKRNGFVWDRSGHFFHFRNPAVRDFFKRSIPAERFASVEKKTSIYYEKYGHIDFPFQKNIHQLPKQQYIECLTDLYMAEKQKDSYSTFKEFVYSTMGNAIAEMFLIPYNQKLYACDLDELDHAAMGRFFPAAAFEDILLNARLIDNSSYNASFSYPLGGAEEFVNVLYDHANKNAEIRLNTTVQHIDLRKKIARLSDGSQIAYDHCINTAPLDAFCSMAGIDTGDVELTANKVAVFNLGFDRKNDHDKHWVYFPGREVFYRVGSYHNILSSDRASLYVEIGLSRSENVNEQELLRRVLVDLENVGIIDADFKLLDKEFVVMDPAYVHITAASSAYKTQLQDDLLKVNAYTAGRYGNWTYCSIEDNMLEAREIAMEVAGRDSAPSQNIVFADIFKA